MCEKELLVSYLYDDLSDADRATFEAHLRGCLDCRREVSELRQVRADLVTWAPSQPDLGFRIVLGRGADTASRPVADIRWPRRQAWRAWWTPAAGLAAAAVLVLAAAAAIAHVEVHRGPDGITVRTGWGASPAVITGGQSAQTTTIREQAIAKAQPASTAAAVDPALLAAIDRRLRALESSRDTNVRAASISARSDADTMRRFRDLLTQSENKQLGELALRISQVAREFDAQRTADLNRIQQRLGRIDASVNAEATAHGELTNYILASARQK
jgi:hypothetical protein